MKAVRAINRGDSRATAVAVQKFPDSDCNVCSTPSENADAAAKRLAMVYNGTRERPAGAAEAAGSVKKRSTRIDLNTPISESELYEVLSKAKPGKAKPGKATSSMAAGGLHQACSASPDAFGLLHGLVSGIFENERAAPPTPQVMPPDGLAPDLATMSHGERLLNLVGGAKSHWWRCQWQAENPKRGLSKDRYEL